MSLSLEGVDVEVSEARNLLATDKGGTTDPYAVTRLLDADGKEIPKETFRTKTWKKTLSPQWREKKRLGDDTLPSVLVGATIEVRIFDEYAGFGVSSEPLGQVSFPLLILAKKSKVRCDAWFALEATPAMAKKGMAGPLGEVRLKCKLAGDAVAIFNELTKDAQKLPDKGGMKDARDDVAEDETHAAMYKNEAANELHIQLTRGKDLPIMDAAVMVGKGSSDPFVVLSVYGLTAKSTVKKKNLNPEWNETFILAVDDPGASLTIEIFDYDLIGSNDFMGKAVVPLSSCLDKLRHTAWHVLTDELGAPLPEGNASVELTLWWKHSPLVAASIAMDLTDDAEDAALEAIALEEAAAIAVEKKKAARAARAAADKEAALAVVRAAKRHQFEEEVRVKAEDDKAALLGRWRADNDAAGKAAGGPASQDCKGPSGEPAWLAFSAWEKANPVPPPAVSFLEWEESMKLEELAVVLNKLGVVNTAQEFVAAYRAKRPEATIDEVSALVQHEATVVNDEDDEDAPKTEAPAAPAAEEVEEEEEEEEEEDEADVAARLRIPNELCVAVVRARGLIAVDKSLMGGAGSSDPRVTLDVDGFTVKTACIKKSLNPVWREVLRLPLPLRVPLKPGTEAVDEEHHGVLVCSVEDVDLLGDNDFMGKTRAISLEGLSARWGPPMWYDLGNEHGEKDQLTPWGSVELRLRVRHNPSLLEHALVPEVTEHDDPFVPESQEHLELPPNELRITLWRGRRLAVMDKSIFGKGGSSDPQAIIRVVGSTVTSTTKKKTLEPAWGEGWALRADAADGILEVTLEDHDAITGNDFMGKVTLPLSKLRHRNATRRWYNLCDSAGKRSGGAKGDLDLQLRWVHNPALVEPELVLDDSVALRPPKGERAASLGKPKNELLVTVIRAKNLCPMNTDGTSDPVVVLRIADGGDQAATSVKAKSLAPIWMETFRLACPEDPGASVDLSVSDHNGKKRAFMGRVNIPLDSLAAGHPHRAWFVLGSDRNGRPDNVTMRGSVELALRWRHNPDYAEGEPLVETDGDEWPDKAPNELRVGLIRARKLPGAEKGKEKGSADPIATFRIGPRTRTSPLKKKTLNPRWNWRCCIPAERRVYAAFGAASEGEEETGGGGDDAGVERKSHKDREKAKAFAASKAAAEAAEVAAGGLVLMSGDDATLHLEVLIEAEDAKGARELIGRCLVPFASLDKLKGKKAARLWFALAPQATGLACRPDVGRCGEVELLLKWAYNPAHDFSDLEAPYDAKSDPFAKKPLNEIAIGLLSATGLNVMDRNPFTGAGSSDPFVRMTVGTSEALSSVKAAELEPTWNERFAVAADEFATALEVTVEDEDSDTAKGTVTSEFMGRATISLIGLDSRQPIRGWFDLTDLPGKGKVKTKADRGRIELVVRWRHNPALEPSPLLLDPEDTPVGLEEVTTKDIQRFGNRLPNEIHITVVRAVKLPSMDKPSRGARVGSTDAFVLLSLPSVRGKLGTVGATKVVAKSQNPVWLERFVAGPLPFSAHHMLRCTLFDRDAAGVASTLALAGDEFVGMCDVPLSGLVDRRPDRRWFRLSDAAGSKLSAAADAASFDDVALADSKDGAAKAKKARLEALTGTPDLGRLELWLRYAYNPKYDPTWVDKPLMVDMPTCTASDLPSLLLEAARQDPNDDDFAGPLGLDAPRWFYLESPRRDSNDDRDDDMSSFLGSGGGGRVLTVSAANPFSTSRGPSRGPSMPPSPRAGGLVAGSVPHGPYNEEGLKELFDVGAIHNATKVWTEGMGAWVEVNDVPLLKRNLWAYPEPPAKLGDPAHTEGESKAAALANARWFFVDDHLGEGPGGAPGQREVVGPETAEELRDRFEQSSVGARVGDGTLAWREGLDDWVALGAVAAAEGVGRAAGWRPRREQRGSPLDKFELGNECCKCGGVATLHSVDALGLDVHTDGAPRHMRQPPPSGRKPLRNSSATVSEVLPDFLWVGTSAAAKRSQMKRSVVTHVINVTADVEDAMKARDLVGPKDGTSIVYLRAAIPDVVGAFEKEHGEGTWIDSEDDGSDFPPPPPPEEDEDEDERAERLAWEAVLAARRVAGPGPAVWKAAFDKTYDFIETAERVEGAALRVMIHASRGGLRANVVAASYCVRKFGLRAAEALSFVAAKCPLMDGAEGGLLAAMAAQGRSIDGIITPGAAAALAAYEKAHALGALFCDDCFDAYRFGEEDAAMSLMATVATQRLRRGDPEMTALDLRGEPLVDAAVMLAQAKAGGFASPEDEARAMSVVSSLAEAIGSTHSPLWRVDLSGCGLKDAGAAVLVGGLSRQPSVSHLLLQYNDLGDDAAASLGQLLNGARCGVALLDLGFNRIGPLGAEALADGLHNNETLATLHLNSNALGDAGGAAVAAVLCGPDYDTQQEGVVLAAAATEAAGSTTAAGKAAGQRVMAQFLFLHRRNGSLTHLNLCCNGLGQATTRQLTEALATNPTLVALELSHNPDLGSAEVKQLATALRTHHPPLELLSIGQMVLGDDVAALFGKILDPKADAAEAQAEKRKMLEEERLRSDGQVAQPVRMPKLNWKACTLRTLHLPHNRLLSTSAKRLATALKANKSLTSLSLPQNPLGPSGAAHLADMLAVNASLRFLDLESCGFTEAAAASLAAGIALNKGLTSLALSENHLGAHGVRHLSAALAGPNSTLRILRLDGVMGGIIGAEFLAKALATNVGLSTLSFSNNRIRNVGASAFAPSLAVNVTLRSVDLSFNEFDRPHGAAPILAALQRATEPGCSREHKTLPLDLDLSGNDGCDDLVAPHLARAKSRWDFVGAMRRSRLASNPGEFPLARSFADPRIKAAYNTRGNNAAPTQGGVW